MDPMMPPPELNSAPPLPLGGEGAAPGPLSFTADQQIALFGGPAEPGQEYTVTVRAGEPGEDGEPVFEVVNEPPAEPAMEAEGSPGDSLEDSAEGEMGIKEDAPEATAALGYDRSALMKTRAKKPAPKLSAKDLEY